MKYLRRYRLNWTVLSPLHLGTGKADIRAQEGEDPSEVALITRDHAGKPWIPGSSIKGALGAACTDAKVRLFGTEHKKDADFARGVLTFSGARYVNKAGSDASITISQTSVAAGTGVAAANKLYRREFVPEGVGFTSEIDVEGSDEAQLRADCAALEALLALAVAPEGMQLGSNKADDLGRLRITGVSIADSSFGPTGWTPQSFAPHTITAAAPTLAALMNLRMVCPGPFISKGGQKDNETLPLMDAAKKSPRIMGTAVSGALRKRAEWLWALHLHRGGVAALKSCKTSAGPKDLDPVQRLFGYEGRRGLLRIEPRDVSHSGTCQIPGVSLDAMTAAPRKELLFFYNTHFGVSFDLSISARSGLDAAETDLFELLKADLETNGLKLGLGTTKGFGWFNASPVATENTNPPRVGAVNFSSDERERKAMSPEQRVKASELENALPHPAITLPYRMIKADWDNVGAPPDPVMDRLQMGRKDLLSYPLSSNELAQDGVCGHIDLSWCFETPMLVGGTKDNEGILHPSALGNEPIIPGSTIKGYIRSIVDIATNAKLDKLDPVSLRADDKRKSFAFAEPQRRLNTTSNNPHRVPCDENYIPDFSEALFGYVKEGGDEGGAKRHEAMHLKSRVAFGTCFLISDHDEARSKRFVSLRLLGADPTAVFYDDIGRKRYPVEPLSVQSVRDRFAAEQANPGEESVSTMRFLYPRGNDLLVFRQRIAVHNLHPIELGALIWALTLNFDPSARHRIGHAKPYGAGQCFVARMNVRIERNSGAAVSPAHPAEGEGFGNCGHGFYPFYAAFGAYQKQSGLGKLLGVDELLAAANPGVGRELRKQTSVSLSEIKYQTSQSIGDGRKDMRSFNNGRLAAMLKKTWSS